jgi:hypothetical protein
MANYALPNQAGTQTAITAGAKGLIQAYASTATAARRGKWYDVLVGTNGTPADNYVVYDISRTTSSPAATLIYSVAIPTPLDGADAAYLGVAYVNATSSTGEPTITSSTSMFNVGVNQRASYRWVAAPGSELVYPATNVNGLLLRVSGTATVTATGTVLMQEQ